MSRTQRILYRTIATYPRQFALIAGTGFAFSLLLSEVLNGAEWVVLASCMALGAAMGWAIPNPGEIRDRLAATLAERNTP